MKTSQKKAGKAIDARKLREAAAKGDTKAIRAMLKAEPELAQDWKPIMDAAYRGDAATITALVKGGVNPNIVSGTAHRYRPLHRVIEFKKTAPRGAAHRKAAEALLRLGADPLARGTYGRVSAVQLAAMDDPSFLPVLLPHVEAFDIFHAAAVCDAERVTALLREDARLAMARDANGWQPLIYCCASAVFRIDETHASAQLRVTELLLGAGASHSAPAENDAGWSLSPLYFCSGRQNNPRLTELLLQAGASPCDGESLYHASDEGHMECLDLFVRYCDAAAIAKEATACLPPQLHWRCTRGLRWLLEHGADPNVLHPKLGNAALHEAVKAGLRDDVIALLLRHGADPTLKNADGKTPIDFASANKNRRVLELLRRSAASTQAQAPRINKRRPANPQAR